MKCYLTGTILLGLAGLAGCGKPVDTFACEPWADWQSYKAALMSKDGRIRAADDGASVSEGQAYALFFALVANDKAAYAKLLDWTQDNLADGDLTARLPAWRWGKREDASWGVIDANAASDADVWLAYALFEAGRLWNEPRYGALALLLAQRIVREETANLPGLGIALLPAPQGFKLGDASWRLNPSYLPIPLLRRLQALDPEAPWQKIVESSRLVIAGTAPKGFAPDWAEFTVGKGFAPDAKSAASGSYDAIRVYLWAGLMNEGDALRRELLAGLAPMAQHVKARGLPPERVDARNGETRGDGPAGFSAALLPFLAASGESGAARTQAARVALQDPKTAGYYDRSLTLFGKGHADGRYRFDADGTLAPRWLQCTAPA